MKKTNQEMFVVLHLNARLQPIHRHEVFEDGLEAVLEKHKLGALVGGGTAQAQSGEITSCDIELSIKSEALEDVVVFIKSIDLIPKGSSLKIGEIETPIGMAEGLALYLNGSDLAEEVYETSDVNELVELLQDALGDSGEMLSHWEGNTETALYFYGASFVEMQTRIASILEAYPLCEKARTVQIA